MTTSTDNGSPRIINPTSAWGLLIFGLLLTSETVFFTYIRQYIDMMIQGTSLSYALTYLGTFPMNIIFTLGVISAITGTAFLITLIKERKNNND